MYRIPPHLAMSAFPSSIESVQLSVPPIAGMGLTQFAPISGFGAGTEPVPPAAAKPSAAPPVIQGEPQPVAMSWSDVPFATKALVFGVGGLLIGGIAWMVYKEMQLKMEIVKQGGGKALAQYELGKAAGQAAVGLVGALGDDRRATPNKPRRRAKRKSR